MSSTGSSNNNNSSSNTPTKQHRHHHQNNANNSNSNTSNGGIQRARHSSTKQQQDTKRYSASGSNSKQSTILATGNNETTESNLNTSTNDPNVTPLSPTSPSSVTSSSSSSSSSLSLSSSSFIPASVLRQQQQQQQQKENNNVNETSSTINTFESQLYSMDTMTDDNNQFMSYQHQQYQQQLQYIKESGTCVIGVIGDSSQGKYMFLNKLINETVYHPLGQPNETTESNTSSSSTTTTPPSLNDRESFKLEIYHDQEKENVFINLNSNRDSKVITNALHGLENITAFELEKWLDHGDYMFMKYLLLMFHVCNIIFLVFENLTIKIEYFAIFKALKHIKQLVTPSINNILLKNTNIPKDLAQFLVPGRCIPILQVFLVKDLTDNYSRDHQLKLEDGLKKQIITLLKSNNLFVPFSHYVNSSKKDQTSVPLFLIELNRPLVRLIRLYQMYNHNINELFQDKATKPLPIQKHYRFYNQLMSVYENGYHNIPTACINSYKYTISNLKQRLPDYSLWESITNSLLPLFEQKESQLQNLKSYVGVDHQFSSKNCSQYYKLAIEQYLEGLPQVYNTKMHQNKLTKALNTLIYNADGPSLSHFVANLKTECDQIWRKGRKVCETESLTGRICTLKTHLLPGESQPQPIPNTSSSSSASKRNERERERERERDRERGEDHQTIEVRTHYSGYRTLATCNCGATTKLREDVFDVEYGNRDFFHQDCCNAMSVIMITLPNTKISYHSPITYQSSSSTTSFSWYSLVNYGKSNFIGIQDPNQSNDVLLPLQEWDFKRIMNIWNGLQLKLTTSSSSIPQSNLSSSTNSSTTTTATTSTAETGKLAFEYQCPVGHRFYEKRRSRKFFVDSFSKNEVKIFYQKHLMEKCTSGECDYMAQLTKVIMLPTIDGVSIQPIVEIQHNDKVSGRNEFALDGIVQLNKDSYYALRLPYVYVYNTINQLMLNQNTCTLYLYITINNLNK